MKNSRQILKNVVDENRNNLNRLRRELNKLLKEGMETNDIYLIGGSTYYLALISYTQGHRTSYFANAYKAACMLENSTDYTMVARSVNLLGIAYVAQGDYALALDAYNKALQTIRAHRSCKFRRDTVLCNIAECYYQMGQYRRSIDITFRCLNTARKKTPDAFESFTIYGLNLSEYLEAAGEYERAKEILDSVKDDAAKLSAGNTLCAYRARRAVVAYNLGDTASGAEYADMIYESVRNGDDTYEAHPDFEKIARECLKIGDLERAKRFTDLLKDYAVTSGHTLDSIIACRIEAEYARTVGDKDRAIELLSRLSELYITRIQEIKNMQFAFQKKVQSTNREVSKLLEKVRETKEIAEKDPLTGLLNRTALISVANEFIHAARANGCMLSGIFIDIDFFKEYNDTYGHAMGDEVIKQVAAACLAEESPNLRFARYGGDEFLGLVLCAKSGVAAGIAARICARLRDLGIEHIKNPNGQRLTVSAGVVDVDMSDDTNTIIDVVNRSDKALYHAKDAGKDAIYEYRLDAKNDAEYIKQEY